VAGPGKKWLLGCGLGCGIPLLVVTVVMIVGGIRMMKPFDAAVATQKELTAAHGPRAEYVPPVDGPTADRLERFLRVRQALAPMCAEFVEIGGKFRRMEELDAGGEEPSKGEIFQAVGGLTSAVFGIASNLGRYTGQRNQALLDAGMGLGEYIWIYTLAYNSYLGYAPNQDFDGSKGSAYSRGEQRIIRDLMANHVEALAAAGRAEEAALWRGELDRLERTEGDGVPFGREQLPPEIAARFAPYRDRLEALYCAETSAFEFGRVRKKGLSISSD
jgi:hypothetical protein